MTADATYLTPPMMDEATARARMLHRMGQWDQALAVLPPQAAAERAEILVDRYWWKLVDADGEAAEAAVRALAPTQPLLAGHLDAQLRYTRLLFGLAPREDDLERARAGFAEAAGDESLVGWAAFWRGVLADRIDEDARAARSAYQQALDHAEKHGDALLESYAVRHLGDHLLDGDREAGIAQLRRSYHLRAALGARPQTAAAAVTLAGELPPGPEAELLLAAAGLTARELGLTWLLSAL